jgi:MarC family integral membrane protein
LLLFAFAGAVLLEALGIGIPAFRIAGGILLFFLALDMIFASPTGLRSRTVREQEEISYEHDISVFPLAIPLLAGPGAITTVLLYTGGRDLTSILVFVAVLLAVMLLNLAALLLAPRIMRRLGETGSEVLTPCSACCWRPWPSSSSSTASSRASGRRRGQLSAVSLQRDHARIYSTPPPKPSIALARIQPSSARPSTTCFVPADASVQCGSSNASRT